MKKILLAIILLTGLYVKAQMNKEYTNPILAGFYPDPSICRVNDDYYLVNSTFAYFPGIPVFHSKDLVNWTLVGHAMDRAEQLDLTGFGVSRGIFAPSIQFHEGLYYITCTLVDGKGNFVITASHPSGPWSNPVWLPEINGIDPSLFFDEDGKSYIIYNSIPPDNQSLYNGHRTIRLRGFDPTNLKTVGEEKILVNGGTDISKKPAWIEGPHILKKYGYYYLIAAEGGTGYDHSVVAFRSKSILGPFQSYSQNPILTQRNLDGQREFPITSTGHAQLLETPGGEWHAVFLGCRPYYGDHYNTGRETFLAPVSWINEWPLINPGNQQVKFHYPLPLPEKPAKNQKSYSGNFIREYNFDSFDKDWIFLRTPKENWYSFSQKKGSLSLKLREETIAGRKNPSFLGLRQQHLSCSATTAISFEPQSENEKAGLAIFQNEDHFYYLCLSVSQGKKIVQLYRSLLNPADSNRMDLIASSTLSGVPGKEIKLRISADGDQYSFWFSTANEKWELLKSGMDGRFLSTRTAGGFVGCTFGLYATSLGLKSSRLAHFNWFRYSGDDRVYKTMDLKAQRD